MCVRARAFECMCWGGGGERNYVAPLINDMIYTAVNLEPKAVPNMHDIIISCFSMDGGFANTNYLHC